MTRKKHLFYHVQYVFPGWKLYEQFVNGEQHVYSTAAMMILLMSLVTDPAAKPPD